MNTDNKPSKHKAQRNHGIQERVKGKERSPMYQPFSGYVPEDKRRLNDTSKA